MTITITLRYNPQAKPLESNTYNKMIYFAPDKGLYKVDLDGTSLCLMKGGRLRANLPILREKDRRAEKVLSRRGKKSVDFLITK